MGELLVDTNRRFPICLNCSSLLEKVVNKTVFDSEEFCSQKCFNMWDIKRKEVSKRIENALETLQEEKWV